MNATHYFLTAWATVFVAYVIFAAIFLPEELTVSRSLSAAGERYRILPFIAGSVVNGLFVHVWWN